MFYKKCLNGKYSIRKFSVGICSVMIGGLFLATSMQVKADELRNVENNVVVSNLDEAVITKDNIEVSLENNTDNSLSTDVPNVVLLKDSSEIREVATNDNLS